MVQLESLIGNSRIHDVNPTTKRLVERCLSGDWCIQLKATQRSPTLSGTTGSPTTSEFSIHSPPSTFTAPSIAHSVDSSILKLKNMKFSKSVENLGYRPDHSNAPPIPRSPLDQAQTRHSNGSTTSLTSLPSTKVRPPVPQRKSSNSVSETPAARVHSASTSSSSRSSSQTSLVAEPVERVVNFLSVKASRPTHASTSSLPNHRVDDPAQSQPRRRPPPPAPPKRRKPPAIPILGSNKVTMHTIRSSEPSPLSRVI